MGAGRGSSASSTTTSLSRYCPHQPWPKQAAFLALDCKEAFYGGAAAGGKSEALLMAALQYVHVPGYAALILRRDVQRLRLSGGLIPRAHQWLAGRGAVWHGRDLRWSFPTGGAPATISFGYLQTSQDKYRYGSSEYQLIAFDELTEFAEEDYLFLFSRLRKTTDLDVPLRMRSASNPGNLGHEWVRRRFLPPAALAAGALGGAMAEPPAGASLDDAAPTAADPPLDDADPLAADPLAAAVLWNGAAAFVPARIADNPAVDEAEYRHSLMHLPTVVRRRLMLGDWSIHEEGLIRAEWLRYYSPQGAALELCDRQGRVFAVADERRCRRLATIDPAGTSADRARQRRGRPPSWSVIQVWDLPADAPLRRTLLLRHVWRRQVGFDGLLAALRETYAAWRPAEMLIEDEKLGRAACDLLGGELPLACVATGSRDKVARAAPLLHRLEQGQVFLPREETAWRSDLEAEWLSWTGLPDEVCDQIDAAAYAAEYAARRDAGPVTIQPVFW